MSQVEFDVKNSKLLKYIKEKFLKIKITEKYKSLFDAIEKKLNVEEVKKCETLNRLLKKYLSERKGKFNIKLLNSSEKHYRQICLSCLIESAKKNNGLKSESEVVYKLLKDELVLFKDEDYFRLRNFIVRVVKPDLYFNLIVGVGNAFYNLDSNGIYEYYFKGIENGNQTAGYWLLEGRVVTPLEKSFNVRQIVGHDAFANYPHIRNKIYPGVFDIYKNYFVICVDTMRSFGYGQRSDSMMFVITSDLKFILEKFSVTRDQNFKILPDTIKRKENFMILFGSTKEDIIFIHKKNASSNKQFYSFKRFIKSFDFDIKINNNKPKEMLLDDKNKNKEVNDINIIKNSDNEHKNNKKEPQKYALSVNNFGLRENLDFSIKKQESIDTDEQNKVGILGGDFNLFNSIFDPFGICISDEFNDFDNLNQCISNELKFISKKRKTNETEEEKNGDQTVKQEKPRIELDAKIKKHNYDEHEYN